MMYLQWMIEVTGHQVECKTCPHCDESVEARFPAGVTQEIQYDECIKVQASYLNVYQLLPMARTSELLGGFYNHAPAPTLVIEANRAVQKGTERDCKITCVNGLTPAGRLK